MKSFLRSLFILALCATPLLTQAQVTITNPLGVSDPRLIAGRVIKGALSVSGSLALLMFVYGGLIWLLSAGRADWVSKGKQVVLWASIGIVAIASAYTVTNAIFNAILTGDVAG
jgi:hypothetical protein